MTQSNFIIHLQLCIYIYMRRENLPAISILVETDLFSSSSLSLSVRYVLPAKVIDTPAAALFFARAETTRNYLAFDFYIPFWRSLIYLFYIFNVNCRFICLPTDRARRGVCFFRWVGFSWQWRYLFSFKFLPKNIHARLKVEAKNFTLQKKNRQKKWHTGKKFQKINR